MFLIRFVAFGQLRVGFSAFFGEGLSGIVILSVQSALLICVFVFVCYFLFAGCLRSPLLLVPF